MPAYAIVAIGVVALLIVFLATSTFGNDTMFYIIIALFYAGIGSGAVFYSLRSTSSRSSQRESPSREKVP
jgi:uncharacterized membrane-anchored protein